jgi:hypothetical protein
VQHRRKGTRWLRTLRCAAAFVIRPVPGMRGGSGVKEGRLVCIPNSNGGRNRDRTYDLCDVNVWLTRLEIELRSRVRRCTSILPQQQFFRFPGGARLQAGGGSNRVV